MTAHGKEPPRTDRSVRDRTDRLRSRAFELGFHAFGVAPADTPDPEGRYRAWLGAGMHGVMSWMAEAMHVTRRLDLNETVPGARSVVALAASYYRPEATTGGPLKVARYAQGRDYHRWLKRRLRKLRKYLLALDPGCHVHPTLDTSPMLEREWAARAGIAWIGKSTMAIHPRLGTYTFLATLVTDSLLSPDEPLPDRCGTCTACIDACPTQAFVEPGVLDARRCIAHWTLEAPGDLPASAPPFHGWVAGCDVCQDVCPWNKFARSSEERETEPDARLAQPSIETFIRSEEEEALEQAIKGTTLARTGARALQRNARRALGLDKD